jgi:hypothetical protein
MMPFFTGFVCGVAFILLVGVLAGLGDDDPDWKL